MNTKDTMIAKFESMNMTDTISSSMAGSLYNQLGSYWEPLYYNWYPSPIIYQMHKDTFAQAFKIVTMMIEKGYIDKITLKKFITLVKEVESEL